MRTVDVEADQLAMRLMERAEDLKRRGFRVLTLNVSRREYLRLRSSIGRVVEDGIMTCVGIPVVFRRSEG